NAKLPPLLSYKTHANKNSLYNTPPCFNIYMVNKVLHWLKDRGGVEAMEKENQQKADLIYAAIDHSNSFYKNNIAPEDRSQMNVVFRLPSETLEKKFITNAQSAGFIGLKGHRSVGGIRISTYNSKSLDDVKNIVAFMKDFAKHNG
ncbi:MAG: aminotransferase class V-fold PLP-dependent enzyme, partial [Planctomycetes bacterium]|nr:aminotransferase class V-fold PLP-dependent enzyme [Planctomycetota bacterium]